MRNPWKYRLEASRGAPACSRPGGSGRWRIGSDVVPAAVGREMPLVRAPAEFGGLAALADEPSTDQVLTNSSGAFGAFATWESRSATWITLMPRSGQASPSRRARTAIRVDLRVPAMLSSACFTKCDTNPGLAPWVSTAVGDFPPCPRNSGP